MTPPTDIVIPFRSAAPFNTEPCLAECLNTLVKTTKNFRLIFVDDNSDDSGREFLHRMASLFPECVVVRTYKQRWFTRAVNLGLRLVRTPWCVELNSDTILGDGWLEELYAVAEEVDKTPGNGRVGLVGSVYAENESRRYHCTFTPNYVTGHCWLIRMEAAEQVGRALNTKDPLDETTPKTIHIFSDNHLCYKMNELGWSTVQSFKSGVGHTAGKSWGHRLHIIPSRCEEVDFLYGK